MIVFYQFAIFLYALIVRLASLFNAKAKLFIRGRKNIWADLKSTYPQKNVVWFHAASLGEFEQGKPVMELLKKEHPEINLLVTFFSPSGYLQQKNYAHAHVFYLPLDTKKNAKKFISITKPIVAIFIRYEFWANYLDVLKQTNTPTMVMAAQFRSNQFAFSFWGKFLRERIKNLDAILVQYQSAADVLLQHNFTPEKIHVCGDSRFDRVLETVKSAEEIEIIKAFKGDSPLIILGSCYADEENFVREAYKSFPNWKFVYAPHFVDPKYVNELISRLPGKAETFTNYQKSDARILVLNTIGKLASAYKYGDIAVVGGGFRDGIHNILEPAAFGLPLFFGPNHTSFPEGQAIIDAQFGFEIDKNGNAKKHLFALMEDESSRAIHQEKLAEFVKNHAGATKKIVGNINEFLHF